jgi:amino acid adenylation domain-containing protein
MIGTTPTADTVATRVATNARQRPGAVAVLCDDDVLTYRDLDRLSDRLAQRLRRLGAGQESRVGVWLPPGVGLAVALLGVVKAGAAYVPLDHRRSAGQLRQVVEESGLRWVIGPPSDSPEWTVRIVQLPDHAILPTDDLGPGPGADNALCVTSVPGPAGIDRFLVTEHRSLTRLLHLAERRADAGRSLRCFPAVAWVGAELFTAWWSGGCAALAGDPAVLGGLVGTHGIEMVTAPAPVFADWARREPAALATVPDIVVVGDRSQLPELAGALPDHTVVVPWGLPEAPVATALRPAGGTELPAGRIGAPVAGSRAYVLDANLRPVPIKVPGDLYLGGTALARGYAGRPELTAAEFLPDPHAGVPGARMYRTSRRARWWPDGTLELLDAGSVPVMARDGGADRVGPRDDLERQVLEIWQEVLGRTGLGVHDDFFTSGGTMPGYARMLAHVDRVLGVELPLRLAATHRTPARLAAAVVESRPALVAQPPDQPLALSFAQERMWFMDQLQSETGVYMVPGVWRLSGRLDTDALERAFRTILRRHTVLRSRIRETADGLTLVVDPEDRIPFELVDLSGEPDVERAARARVETEAARAFGADDPMSRVLLLRLGPDDHVLQVVVHHATFDGNSDPLLAAELSEAYTAYVDGREPRLPELTVQYSDYAAWQRTILSGRWATELADHWRKTLDGAPPALELPGDHVRPPVPSNRGRALPFTVPSELVARLRELARARDTDMYTVALAAYQLLLGRYAATRDVVVGTPADARQMPELEPLIGPLVNALPLRTRIDDDLRFVDFLDRVRDVARDAFAHQDLPFARLVEELSPSRDLSRNPIFQAWFQLMRRVEDDRPALPGIQVADFLDPEPTVQFDLVLHLLDRGGTMSGVLVAARDLFEEPTMRRLVEHYTNVLVAITERPESPLSELDVIGPAERDQLLHGWNGASATENPQWTVTRRFDCHVRDTPDAPALVCGDIRLTYRELDRRAEQLAAGLRARGIGIGALVAVCLPRELDLPVALLAVARSGAGYVGLEPTDPPGRLREMVRESGAVAVLTDSSVATDDWPVPSVTLTELARAGRAATAAPLPVAGADDVLYVLFTSGATGRPKGVVMSHGPTARLMAWAGRRYRSCPVALAYFPVTSDVFSYELWSTWWTGGCVVLATETERFDVAVLADRIAEHGVTTLLLPGAMLDTLAAVRLDHLGSVTEVITTGDRLRITEPIRQWAEQGIRLDNQWGSTEVNVVTAGRLERVDRPWPTMPGIGSPVSGGRIYVLDEHLRPAPVGVPGDLYVGGTQLAHGYLGRPDLTASAFLPDPYAATAGTRMYATGDRGRWLEDGTLRFLGRADLQVKVHGYRVEPGEIEAVLAEHPDIARAAVVARSTDLGVRLAAYLLAAPGHATPATPALREWLAHRLPDHMMPAALTWLDTLPTTGTGKIDRRALPEIDFEAAERTPARDEVDQTIIDIWQEALGRTDVGISNNFFDLGGHSLLIPQVIYRMNKEFGVDLPLRTLFRVQTVMELADEINAGQGFASEGSHGGLAASRA